MEKALETLKGGRYNWTWFAAQQAAEKALKSACMVIKRRLFPKTHGFLELYSEFSKEIKD